MPEVRLLIETPGRLSGAEHLHEAGEVINVDDGLAQYWIQEGRAELIGRTGPELIRAAKELPPKSIIYADMTVKQLVNEAQAAGLSYRKKKKDELIEMLEGV